MKVKCEKLHKLVGSNSRFESWLTIGREYSVLAIDCDPQQGVLLRILGDDRFTPALFPGELFEVTDPKIPTNWIIIRGRGGLWQLSPRAWGEPGFWEKFFDRDPAAIGVFDAERQVAEGT
jgi:hypothetical protein